MTVYRVEPWIAHVVKTSNAGRLRKPDCSRIWGFFSFPLCTQQTYSGCAPDVRKRKLQKKNEGKKVSKISRQFFFSFLLEQVKSECARDRNGGGVSSHLYNRWSVKKYAGVPLKKKKERKHHRGEPLQLAAAQRWQRPQQHYADKEGRDERSSSRNKENSRPHVTLHRKDTDTVQ